MCFLTALKTSEISTLICEFQSITFQNCTSLAEKFLSLYNLSKARYTPADKSLYKYAQDKVYLGMLGKRHGNIFRVEFTIEEVWKYSQATFYLRRRMGIH